MNRHSLSGSCVALALLLALGACSRSESREAAAEAPAREQPLVITTFYPTEYLVERLAGPWVELRCDVPADQDALFWTPSDEQVLEYQKANLIVLNGAGLEKWTEHMSLPLSRVVDSSRSFEERFVHFEGVAHSHGGGPAHAHTGTDPHVWLDPLNAEQQALAIRAALGPLLSEHESELQQRMSALSADLKAVHRSYEALGQGREGEWVIAAHPAYNYLAARYGWRVVNLDLDPSIEPTEEELGALREHLNETPARFILWESEPLAATAARLRADFGLESVVVSPCELLSPEERASGANLLDTLRRNGEALARALAVD